jgi:hypothetical protein
MIWAGHFTAFAGTVAWDAVVEFLLIPPPTLLVDFAVFTRDTQDIALARKSYWVTRLLRLWFTGIVE